LGGKLLILGVVLALAGWWISSQSHNSSPSSLDTGGGGTHTVEYSISGATSSADVTMQGADGGTVQRSGVQVPSTLMELTGPSGAFVYLSAQNTQDIGDITCTISIDGVAVFTTTSTGGYVIATCSGSIP
jgi:hypothetical protein